MNGIAWGRLLRLSLSPSAAADALAGITIGAWGAFPLDARVALVALGSLCVFHGGMALNDWADREGDARTRPDRPIPAGAVRAPQALRLAVALLVLGPLITAAAAPSAGACLAGVALTAAFYDLAGRGAWLGPTLLGLCRGGNLASGVLAGAALAVAPPAHLARWPWVVCGLYALYVYFASRLARLEDDEDAAALGGRPTRALLAACACLAVAPWTAGLLRSGSPLAPPSSGAGLLASGSSVWILQAPALLLCGISAALLATEALRREAWTPERVGRAAGMSLRRLLVFTAACAWCAPMAAGMAGNAHEPASVRAFVVAPALLLGYPIALRLRGIFPPT